MVKLQETLVLALAATYIHIISCTFFPFLAHCVSLIHCSSFYSAVMCEVVVLRYLWSDLVVMVQVPKPPIFRVRDEIDPSITP